MASIRDNAEERKAEREATSRRPKTNDDRGVAIYHLVPPHEGFEESARTLFGLVRRAQTVKPGRTRTLLLDIEGHRDADGGFDADMLVELQNAFLVGFKTTTSPPSRSSRIARGNIAGRIAIRSM